MSARWSAGTCSITSAIASWIVLDCHRTRFHGQFLLLFFLNGLLATYLQTSFHSLSHFKDFPKHDSHSWWLSTMLIAKVPAYSHCPTTSSDSDEVDSSSESSIPPTSSTTDVMVHLVIGSINWPSNVSSWPDAARRVSRFLRVSLTSSPYWNCMQSIGRYYIIATPFPIG